MISKNVEKFLLDVQKPGRYVGGEINSVVKDIKDIDVRFAFCFPDIYEVGMSHLGLKILYSLFNSKPYIWCERVFAPWIDMEQKLRINNIPLYALESGDSITNFDFIGFTLQYELSYTNVLNMLDLANIPLKSKDRTGLNQIIVAGGPCACNPEPLADFIDIFFIGEGEEVDLEVIELYRKHKKMNSTREEFLREAANIKGVYVPKFYDVNYNNNGTIKSVVPNRDVPKTIHKRIVMDLDKSYYPDKFIVPFIEIVHDRTVAEIFRGCIRGCRFCQAGYIYRPTREKSVATIDNQCKNICDNTGYDEISLSSLSSSDYTKINELLDTMFEWTQERKISVSLPSMRVDAFSDELVNKLKSIRRGGLTFAPEAGTQRLRDVINKNVTETELINTCNKAFSGGWSSVKLYFMIGLPTETLNDIKGIAELGKTVVNTFYSNPNRQKRKAVKVTLSVSSFVPKPFTPFQWEPQDTVSELMKKQEYLKSSIESKKISFNYHEANTSFLEGVFARGDRKLCDVLEEAYKLGCKFDGWNDCFDINKWLTAFKNCSIDPHFYTNRKRNFNEVLPWDHIDYGIKKEFLIEECEKSYKNETTLNCREKCSKCGANRFKGGVCFEEC